MKSFPSQLTAVQRSAEDFEWYPTTAEIITAMKTDLVTMLEDEERYYLRHARGYCGGFLDIGAGNGKVLDAVAGIRDLGSRYAIEKSSTLLNLLPAEVFILGCDFWNTSLMDKQVAYIFSNPPYSEFEPWTVKILREAPSHCAIWLVLPERWEKSVDIRREIEARKVTTTVLGSFDFLSAEDRKARAKVHLVRLCLPIPTDRYGSRHDDDDPFTRFFNETFTFAPEETDARPFDEQLEETRVVHRLNFIEALCHLYDARIEELRRNYQAVCSLSPDILKEFEISRQGMIASLQMKLATARKEYWERLFDGMAEIHTRLTHASRRRIQELMQSQTGIEFNRENAYAIILWVIKNANSYFDSQLIATYEKLISHANVENYKSNARVFRIDRFRYSAAQDKESTHFRLKVGHRMVLHHCGGLKRQAYTRSGLCDTAANFLCDLLTVARNLGFNVIDPGPREYEWDDSDAYTFRFRNAAGKVESLFRVRAFLNWNLHMQFHPEFIHALNVQHGRLRGWLRDDAEAAEELEIPREIASRHFKPGFLLTHRALAITGDTEAADATPDPSPARPFYEQPEIFAA